LYGEVGDSGTLGPAELEHYRKVTAANADQLSERVRPGDIVIIHECQPAGLIEAAKDMGAVVIWRRHIGRDQPNEHTRDGWAFLRRFVEPAHATVFLTESARPAWAPMPTIIPPSIDPCGPKNMPLPTEQVQAILATIGVLDGADRSPVTVRPPIGEPVVVSRPAVVVRDGAPPPSTVPMVAQVSRWDVLKDMTGVLEAFVAAEVDACLTLAGADVTGVGDDPEAAEMFDACRRRWEALPADPRRRCQLVCLPMEDLRENALMVNALQRHATVVVQKSLAEGFGLTATEAMWKARPLLASAVGGLRDQVVHGESGLLVADPRDLTSVAEGIRRLLSDPELATRLGGNAQRRVTEQFLPDRHLLDWARVIEHTLARGTA
jgi:trehalose synthase